MYIDILILIIEGRSSQSNISSESKISVQYELQYSLTWSYIEILHGISRNTDILYFVTNIIL